MTRVDIANVFLAWIGLTAVIAIVGLAIWDLLDRSAFTVPRHCDECLSSIIDDDGDIAHYTTCDQYRELYPEADVDGIWERETGR